MKRQSVKHNNRRFIVDFLRSHEEVPITQITKAVRVSTPTVKKVLDHYMNLGLVIMTGKGESTLEGGKRPELYRLNQEYGYAIALHVGPDFIYAGMTDLKLQNVQSFHEVVDRPVSDIEMVDKLVSIAKGFRNSKWAEGKKLVNVVIALPGIVNAYTGESIYSPHYPQWQENFPFIRKFAERFDMDIPIFLDGVNRLQACAERMKGKARGKQDFLIVDAMEEGVGAGIIVQGTIMHGFNNLSGEIGHVIVDPHGPDCICGGKGCFEAAVSVKHINRLLRQGYDTHRESAIYQGKSPADVSIRDLFIHANQGDAYAIELLDLIAAYFANGLNNVIMISDPELIIIQGIYVEAGQDFIENIKKKLSELSLPRVKREFDIVYTDFGIERGALGAGCFGISQFFEEQELYR
ncbi:MAG: hypothetical protein CVV48_05980 [Spirochaetae bacterium HGW-Spirochaetae-4]|nr:MAG: hypothetical protein CVV48_05980 [Spirochaetae bacterium HGW-Spirochaetae-4]